MATTTRRHQILQAFDRLDGAQEIDPDDVGPGQFNPRTYDVRLDAYTDERVISDDDRAYRIRVTPGSTSGGLDRDEWLYVLEIAGEFDLHVTVENNGLVLR